MDLFRRLRAGREILVLLAYLLLASVETGIGTDLGTRCFAGGATDPGHDIYVLHWVANHLYNPRMLFEGPTFYPSHDSILYDDPLMGPAVLVQPVRLLSDNPVLLYNVAILLSLLTAAYGFYRLALNLVHDARAALLAGIVIPFTAQQLSQLWHLNLLTISGFPFLMLALMRLFEKPSVAWALGLGAAFGLQAGTSGYHAFSCLFLCLLFALWGWRRFRHPATWGHFAVAAVLAIVILLPYVIGFHYVKGHEAHLQRSHAEQVHFSIDIPGSLLVSNAYLWRTFRWARGVVPLFPGVTVIFLAVLGLREARAEPAVRLLLVVGLFFLALALGPQMRIMGHRLGPGPFSWLVGWVPLLSSVRHPMTFVLPSIMALGLIACVGFSRSGLSRSWAGPVLLAAAVIETLVPKPPRTEAPRILPEVYRVLGSQPAGAFLDVWAPSSAEGDPLDPDRSRWWAMFHGIPLVNGAAAFEPGHYTDLSQRIRHEWKASLTGDLEGSRSLAALKTNFPIRYLVVHSTTERAVRESIAATSQTFLLISELPGGDRIYRVRRGGTGHLIMRVLRDDQLANGCLKATMRGPAGMGVTISVGDVDLMHATLTDSWQSILCPVPRALVQRGPNENSFEGAEDAAVELQDLDTCEATGEP